MKETALVTGASRGIGRGIAYALAKEGYDLILICHENTELLTSLAQELKDTYQTRSFCFTGDVSDYSFLLHVKKEMEKESPIVTVIVNNAGISYYGLLNDMEVSEWHRVINTNLSSMFYTTKLFSPEMISRKSGHIINITSMWGQRGASCEVCYSASKGGVDAYTKALAKELAPSNVFVNAISCGVIDTDMMKIFGDEERADLAEEIPMGRFGTPEEVGKAVVSLLSNSYMTGQIIGLDGGYF